MPHLFSFNTRASTSRYPLSLHDALPIFSLNRTYRCHEISCRKISALPGGREEILTPYPHRLQNRSETVSHTLCQLSDRKSTRLNSSHVAISYAVFCLKKKKKRIYETFVK